MCNPKPSSPSSLLSQKKTPTTNLNESGDPQPDDHQELHRWPTLAEVKKLIKKKQRPHAPTTNDYLYIYI